MAVSRTVQFEVSEEVAEFLHRKVETGDFADEGAVVQHALEEATEADAKFEKWVQEQVLPTLERMDREGWSGLTSEDVFKEIQTRNRARALKA